MGISDLAAHWVRGVAHTALNWQKWGTQPRTSHAVSVSKQGDGHLSNGHDLWPWRPAISAPQARRVAAYFLAVPATHIRAFSDVGVALHCTNPTSYGSRTRRGTRTFMTRTLGSRQSVSLSGAAECLRCKSIPGLLAPKATQLRARRGRPIQQQYAQYSPDGP
ncbi:hypothetical protein Q3G72_033979 [Acer saccharum]|nr:hypothetical protein Q3G72_033979 [Acer saccharum]